MKQTKPIGYWDGEQVDYDVVTVPIVEIKEPITHWQNLYVGTTRQCIKLFRDGYTWFIDNEDGSGLRFVTETHGMWNSGTHRSITLNKELEYPIVPIDEWKSFDLKMFKQMDIDYNNWVEKNYPEVHEKLQAVRKIIENSRINGKI